MCPQAKDPNAIVRKQSSLKGKESGEQTVRDKIGGLPQFKLSL
jgi:hypothetical protein